MLALVVLDQPFWTGEGCSLANLHKWWLDMYDFYACHQQQTMMHVVDSCPLTKLEDDLQSLNEAGVEGIIITTVIDRVVFIVLSSWQSHCVHPIPFVKQSAGWRTPKTADKWIDWKHEGFNVYSFSAGSSSGEHGCWDVCPTAWQCIGDEEWFESPRCAYILHHLPCWLVSHQIDFPAETVAWHSWRHQWGVGKLMTFFDFCNLSLLSG